MRTYPSPSRRAVVFIPPNASDPDSGSVIAHAPMCSKVASFGSHRCFCASVPRVRMVCAVRPRLTPTEATRPRLTPAISLTAISASDSCPPNGEPARFGLSVSGSSRRCCLSSSLVIASRASTSMPNADQNARMMSYGGSCPDSRRSRCGRISLSANPRIEARISRSVSDHSNIGPPLDAYARH
ncbi:hypothetical protein H4W33_000670 [Kibdelosporangium phytohabitans]|nr:hypothetical protein [Kibdelosporangium phytohabitans]